MDKKHRINIILTYCIIVLLVICLLIMSRRLSELQKTVERLESSMGSVSEAVSDNSDFLEDIEERQGLQNKKFIRTVNEDGTTAIACSLPELEQTYTFYQLPLTGNAGGFCYAIEMPDHRLVMIDSGYEGEGNYVRDFIMKHGGVVDSWFITHPHIDHVGGLIDILSDEDYDGVKIERIYYNPFTDRFFEEEEAGKDLSFVNYAVMYKEFQERMTACTDIEFIPVEMGDELVIEDITVNCLYSFQEGVHDVNANSLVLHFDIAGATMLVTGDITDQTLSLMRKHWGDTNHYFNVDFLQIPHHGYIAGISNDILFQLTMPECALLDCSAEEYRTNAVNILTLTEWVENLDIPVLKRFQGPNTITIY